MKNARKSTCSSSTRVTAALLLSFLTCSSLVQAEQVVLGNDNVQPQLKHATLSQLFNLGEIIEPTSRQSLINSQGGNHERFTLRHVLHHGTYHHPNLLMKLDVQPDSDLHLLDQDGTKQHMPPLYISSQPTRIERLRDRRPSTIESMRRAGQHSQLQVLDSAWGVEDTSGPNVTDKDTVLSLAYMTYDAYYLNESIAEWLPVGEGFNRTLDVGWEESGLRGHVFTNEDNSTVVVGLKGTTPGYWDSVGDTTANDKLNDNLFGSCCCAQQGPIGSFWKQVCDCATGTYSCNKTCLVSELSEDSRYYTASLNLYSNVTALYPNANIWVAGHSLGGLVSSLLGQTFGLPAVTFEAVPDALASERLNLPIPPSKKHPTSPRSRSGTSDTSLTGVYHFGHTADPVYMGTCGSASSTCSLLGYAFEAQCHTAYRCVYDTVADQNLAQRIWYHPIAWVIDNVLKAYDKPPICEVVQDCVDCFNWKFYESHNDTRPTATASASATATETRSRTRTETCKTPGWWGCLDSSTTEAATTTFTQTAPITTTATLTTTDPSTSTTSSQSCTSKGWFGCLDPTTTEIPIGTMTSTYLTTITTSQSLVITATRTSTSTSVRTSVCRTPGWFGACNDVGSTSAISTNSISVI